MKNRNEPTDEIKRPPETNPVPEKSLIETDFDLAWIDGLFALIGGISLATVLINS